MFNIDSRAKLTVAVSFILATLSPGIVFLFIFAKKAFYYLDFWKIFALSISVTVPIFSLNFLSIFLALSEKNRKKYRESNEEKYKENKKMLIRKAFISATFWTAAIFYGISLVGFFIDIAKITTVLAVIILELIYLFLFTNTRSLSKIFFQDV